MKKLLSLLLTSMIIFGLCACTDSNTNPTAAAGKSEGSDTTPSGTVSDESTEDSMDAGGKALVVYFSWSGNTKNIAEEIASQTGADTFELIPVNAYSTDYNTVLDEAQTEQNNNARPEITGTIDNFTGYDVIYLGFPNWWGDMPMILYSFLDNYDLSGKTICPFVSSGGSGFSNTIDAIGNAEPNAIITDGLSLSSAASKTPSAAVSDWLTTIGS